MLTIKLKKNSENYKVVKFYVVVRMAGRLAGLVITLSTYTSTNVCLIHLPVLTILSIVVVVTILSIVNSSLLIILY